MDSLPVSSTETQAEPTGRRAVGSRPRHDGREASRETYPDARSASSIRADVGPARPPRVRVDHLLGWFVFLGGLALILAKAPGLDYFLSARDHGYQLCMGTQILLGKVPGVDVVCAYGPMVMYASALGLRISQSMLGEVFICAAGYALCLFLIYRLVGTYSSRAMGILAVAFGFILLSRFYKWYIWLIPLATLWVLHRYVSSPVEQRRRWGVASGLVGGLCWLFRPDLGTMLFAVDLVYLGVIEACSRPRGVRQGFRDVFLFLAVFPVLPLCWLGYLGIAVGAQAPIVYLKTTIAAAISVATGMAQPLTDDSVVILGYIAVPATLLLGTMIGLRRELGGSGDARSRFLLASGLVGLGVFHQAMHRMGPIHLLQVISPALVCAFIALDSFLRRCHDVFLADRAAGAWSSREWPTSHSWRGSVSDSGDGETRT